MCNENYKLLLINYASILNFNVSQTDFKKFKINFKFQYNLIFCKIGKK